MLTLAVDTNVVSHAVRYPDAPISSIIKSEKLRVCTSEVCLEELMRGNTCGEADFLRQLNAQILVLPSDPKATSPIFKDVDECREIIPSTEAANSFPIKFSAKMAGSKAPIDLASEFEGAMEKIIQHFEEEASGLGYENTFEKLRDSAQNAAKETPDTLRKPGAVFSANEQKKYRFGPQFLNNVHAPNVIQKILNHINLPTSSELHQLFPPFAPISYETTRVSASVLSNLGFQRDSRIGKADINKSIIGATSQWRDIEHLTVCCGVHAFATLDAACAKLAYSVYEAFGINSHVFHASAKDYATGKLELVGADYWP